jgi:hypothetical protein
MKFVLEIGEYAIIENKMRYVIIRQNNNNFKTKEKVVEELMMLE